MTQFDTRPAQLKRQEEEANAFDEAIRAASDQSKQDDPAKATEPETTDEPKAEPPKTPDQGKDDIWEQRYKTLAGKYNAEVPRLNSQIRDLTKSVEELTEQAKAKPTSQDAPPKQVTSTITPEDIESYGPEMIDLIKRQAQEVASQVTLDLSEQVSNLVKENRELKQKLGGVEEKQAYSSQKQVLNRLTELVPSWEELNVDQGFLAWLAVHDHMSGLTRQEMLNNAFDALDPDRLAWIFKAYLTETGTPAQPAPAQSKEAPRKPDIEGQLTPGRAKTGDAPRQPDSKTWTQGEIQKFYADVSKGVYKGREAEAQKIEGQIDLAMLQGRVK